VTDHVRSRVYAPFVEGVTTGLYRVERYSLTALWGELTGTRLRVRSPQMRFERTDLTVEQAVR